MPSRRSSVLNLFDPLVICTTKPYETPVTFVTPVHATAFQDNDTTPPRHLTKDASASTKDQISLTAFFNRTFSRPKEAKAAVSKKPQLSRLMEPLVEISDEPETSMAEDVEASPDCPSLEPLIEFGSPAPEVIKALAPSPEIQGSITG